MTVSDENGELASWKISSARGGYTHADRHVHAALHVAHALLEAVPLVADALRGVLQRGRGGARRRNAIGNLGSPASHGCVRSQPKNAKIFYNLVQKHGMQLTRVVVHGKPPYSPVVAEGRRRRYAQQPAYQPFGGSSLPAAGLSAAGDAAEEGTAAATATPGERTRPC